MLVRRRTNQRVLSSLVSSKSFEASSTVSSTASSSSLEAWRSRGSNLEAPEALGAAVWKLQRLWEQPSRGARGSGSSHLEAPEALGAATSRPQRLREQPSQGSRGSSRPSASNFSFFEFFRVRRALRASWSRLETSWSRLQASWSRVEAS